MGKTSQTASRAGSGMLTLGLLCVLFIGLKLTGHWQWIWVLFPFWIPWAIIDGMVVIFLFALLIVATVEWAAKKLK